MPIRVIQQLYENIPNNNSVAFFNIIHNYTL